MLKLILIPFLLIGGLCAADFEACPAKIDVQRQQLTKPLAGWTAAVNDEARHELWYVTLYDGEPKEKASLVPDVQSQLKQGWTLARQSRPYWLECHYTQTTIVLARPLPANLKSCEVTHEASTSVDGQPAIKQILCR
jgi:hypothetical protein